MKGLPFSIVDVFAEEKYAGNQLAVVRNAAELTDGEMQKIAQEMNYSETTFIASDAPRDGGFDVRIFTPDRELPFAGHPTLGTAYIIQSKLLDVEQEEILLNYKIGQIKVSYQERDKCRWWMRQKAPTFHRLYEREPIARILGREVDDLDDRFPIQEVSTGTPAIMAPLKTLASIKAIKLDYELLSFLPKDPDTIGILPFCPETESEENHLHVRFFTTMESVPEDPATGSANGCLAGYLVEHQYFGKDTIDVRVEQGYEIRRPSLLNLKAAPGAEGIDIDVGGNVVLVADGFLR